MTLADLPPQYWIGRGANTHTEESLLTKINTRIVGADNDEIFRQFTAFDKPTAKKHREILFEMYSEGLRLGTLAMSIIHTFKQ